MIRKATLGDAEPIYKLIEIFAERGEMLPRPISELYDDLRDFYVYEEGGAIVGASALHLCWENLGEIRSLAIKDEFSGRGIGTSLVERCIEDGLALGVKKVFVLTYIPPFFKRLGFKDIDKDKLPHKIWSDCLRCVKFPDCDENALMKEL